MAEITIRISDKALRIVGVLLCLAVLVSVFFSLWSSGFFLPKYQLSVYVPEGLLGNRYVSISRGFTGSVIKSGGEVSSMPSKVLTLKDSLNFFRKLSTAYSKERTRATLTLRLPRHPPPNLRRRRDRVFLSAPFDGATRCPAI